jgi:phenylpropionate dioxygenase-like ring-hydroxylating dioxygenase large terminal subunit
MDLLKIKSLDSNWQPIAIADKIKKNRAYSIWFNHKPLVIFRAQDNQIQALDDLCPHRQAPLSQGKIIQGEIQCPYHGWQFNGDGVCTRVPGLQNTDCQHSLVKSWLIKEEQGLVWCCDQINSDQTQPFNPVLPLSATQSLDCFFMQDKVQTDLLSLIENFLDAFHTHFVHAGLIRQDKQRQTIQAEVKALADGIEVSYSGETNQNGLVSRFLEPKRGISLARFRLPNFAEIEYRNPQNQINLLVSVWAVNEKPGVLSVIARIATARGFIPAALKKIFLNILFKKVMQQDKTILEKVQRHKNKLTDAGIVLPTSLNTPLDLLNPWLKTLIQEQQAVSFPTKQVTIEV